MLVDVELVLRGAALGLTVLVALLSAGSREPAAKHLTFGLAIAVAAFLLLGVDSSKAWPDGVRLTLQLTAIVGVYCFWGLARLLFEDRFGPRPWHIAIVALMLCAGATRLLVHAEHPSAARWILRVGVALPTAVLVVHLLWVVASDFRDDLLERRRRARLLFIAAGAVLVGLTLLTPWIFDSTTRLYSGVIEAGAFLLAQLLLLPTVLELRLPTAARQIEPALAPAMSAPADTNRADAEAVSRAMNADRLYRETGLTIVGLSERLGVPEYRLRRAIHEALGFRNFSDFLNAWRLKEAAERLRDSSQHDTPILTIALHVGYGSIGPFNRAFKARFGVTPSEYRRGGVA